MRNRNRKAPNPLTKTFESNGPDVKVRGTAQHIAEKYTQLSRDAHVAGDPVAAENYLQHAEHYLRIILAAQAQYQQNFGFPRSMDEDQEDGADDGAFGYGYGVQDYGAPQPDTRQHEPRQHEPRTVGQRQPESRFAPAFDDEGQPPQRDRPERNARGQDRQQERQPQERSERPERQDRRERFRRRREDNVNGFAQAPEDAGAARQLALPAFLTTPVRPAAEADEQPAIAREVTADPMHAEPAHAEPVRAAPEQPAEAVVAAPVVEAEVTPTAAPVEPPPAPAAEAETPAPRTRRRRAAASEETAGEEVEPVRKLRATRTRKKTVDSDLPVAE
jgi:hypothetical protein